MYKIIKPFTNMNCNIRKISSNKNIDEELKHINKNLSLISVNINLLTIITTLSSAVYLIRSIFNV